MQVVSLVLLLALCATLACSLPIGNSSTVHPDSFGCEPGESVCSKCYGVLEKELFINDRNRYSLQRAFFPPDTTNPVFVGITYYFTRNMSGNGSTDYSLTSPSQNWYWTESTFYLFQPTQSLQFTSLLFADSTFRQTSVSLYLQPNCEMADLNMMKLLTQRMKLYAMQQRERPPITNTYSAKGENLETLKQFHAGENKAVVQGQHFTRYAFAFQVLFPIIVLFFLLWFFKHLSENPDSIFKTLRAKLETHDNKDKSDDSIVATNPSANSNTDTDSPNPGADPQTSCDGVSPNSDTDTSKNDQKKNTHHIRETTISTRNMHILMLVICSITFAVYVLALDIVAVTYRHVAVIQQIFYLPERNGTDYGEERLLFELEYSVPIVILCYDIVVFVIMVGFLFFNRCGAINRKWYIVIFAPVSCIVVHSYHIIIAFIHTPQHATSILIFYAVVMLIFYVTLKAAYHNLFQMYHSDCMKYLSFDGCWCCCCCMICWNSLKSLWNWSWNCRCTSVSNDDEARKCCTEFKIPHSIVMTIMSILAVFITGTLVFVVVLFILVPINMAIDDAPARLYNIHQTIIVFIGAAITYKLYKKNKEPENPKVNVDKLAEALNEYIISKQIQPTAGATPSAQNEQPEDVGSNQEISTASP